MEALGNEMLLMETVCLLVHSRIRDLGVCHLILVWSVPGMWLD